MILLFELAHHVITLKRFRKTSCGLLEHQCPIFSNVFLKTLLNCKMYPSENKNLDRYSEHLHGSFRASFAKFNRFYSPHFLRLQQILIVAGNSEEMSILNRIILYRRKLQSEKENMGVQGRIVLENPSKLLGVFRNCSSSSVTTCKYKISSYRKERSHLKTFLGYSKEF